MVGIVTKLDKTSKDAVGERLIELHEMLGPDSEVVPVSATEQVQLDVLLNVLVSQLPEGPRFYPQDHVTDEDMETRIAELIREEALKGLREELPHSVAVQVDEMVPDPDNPERTMIYAVVYL